jgi:hypothetical protein
VTIFESTLFGAVRVASCVLLAVLSISLLSWCVLKQTACPLKKKRARAKRGKAGTRSFPLHAFAGPAQRKRWFSHTPPKALPERAFAAALAFGLNALCRLRIHVFHNKSYLMFVPFFASESRRGAASPGDHPGAQESVRI